MADFTNSASFRDPRYVERYKSVDNAYTTTGTKTITLNPSPGLRAGYARFRTKSVNASSVNQFEITAYDGTTAEEILPTTAASAAGVVSEIILPYQLEITAGTFSLTVTLTGNGNETVDFEVVGTR